MKKHLKTYLLVLLCFLFNSTLSAYSSDYSAQEKPLIQIQEPSKKYEKEKNDKLKMNRPAPVIPDQPSFETDVYRNMFVESGKSNEAVDLKLNQIWEQYFVNGNVNTEKLYYEVDADMAYILDTGNNDIRSEGMSYGMMICVQLDKKEYFDKLWKFAKQYSQHKPGTSRDGLFSWQLTSDTFSMIDQNSAPDGEEYFVTALFFAHARWGSIQSADGFDPERDVFDYEGQANYILKSMLNKPSADSGQCPTNLIDTNQKQVVFGICGDSATYTDPSYHLPAFYDIWALYADNNNQLWSEMAETSRTYLLPRAAHPVTGLMPDYSEFDGTPKAVGTHANFEFDAWRNIMNMGFDFAWFQKNKNDIQPLIDKQIDFFKDKPNYPGLWTLDGTTPRNSDHNAGLVACNAVGSLALGDAKVWPFVDELFEMSIPSGTYRYYDGLLYMMSFMHVAGAYKIFKPDETGNQSPIANFTTNISGGIAPITINFDASTSSDPDGDQLSYTWDFGDGQIGTGMIITHEYATAGNYEATLVVSDGSKEATKSMTISVTDNAIPVANFTVSVDSGIAPLEVDFDASTSSNPDGGTLSYSWDFGNGQTATTVRSTTTYTEVGQVVARLTVTNQAGKTAIAEKTITITGDNPTCNFGTPISTPLPSLHSDFKNIYVLGNGGPNLDNVTNFTVNWDLANNGIYQFSMNTNNGIPSWWNNFLPKIVQNFNSAQPEITLSATGIPELDGSYWVTVNQGDFVMVSKTDGFVLYFSAASTAPECDNSKNVKNQTNIVLVPNPATSFVDVFDNNKGDNLEINIVDFSGKTVSSVYAKDIQNGFRLDLTELSPGAYILEIRNSSKKEITRKKIIINR